SIYIYILIIARHDVVVLCNFFIQFQSAATEYLLSSAFYFSVEQKMLHLIEIVWINSQFIDNLSRCSGRQFRCCCFFPCTSLQVVWSLCCASSICSMIGHLYSFYFLFVFIVISFDHSLYTMNIIIIVR
ncbi:hypothetical protein T11_6167, partial [Trichinella zimbabwensis]